MLNSILASATGNVTNVEIAICTGISLVLGVLIACVYMFRNVYTKNFVITIALLPAIIQSIIMIVNGNLGTGVAVMGAFGLIRFRSVPGSAKEITHIFFAMAVGLAAGMGYVIYATIFTIVIGMVMILYTALHFGEQDNSVKNLRVMIPEDLDYVHLFDDLFEEYTHHVSLEKARTTNLGGLYELQYTIILRDKDKEKEFLDKIRQRNGNLTISCGRMISTGDTL